MNWHWQRLFFSISFLTITGLILSVTAARLVPTTPPLRSATDPQEHPFFPSQQDQPATIMAGTTKQQANANGNANVAGERPDMNLLLSAINFSAQKHRNQRRKNPMQEPYINHPISVADRLAKASVTDVNVLAAAILHDTVEDTETTLDELRAQFGETIATIVSEVSDDKTLPKERRKQLQIEHAPHCSHSAKLVKLADKLDNLSDLLVSIPISWSPERVAEYFSWSEKVISGLRGTNSTLETQLDDVLSKRQVAVDIAAKTATNTTTAT